jgi:hypothetical protein
LPGNHFGKLRTIRASQAHLSALLAYAPECCELLFLPFALFVSWTQVAKGTLRTILATPCVEERAWFATSRAVTN